MNTWQLYGLAVLWLGFSAGCSSDDTNKDEDPQKSHLVHVTETVSAGEFVSWCSNEENQLSKTKTISEMMYKVIFLPSESMAYTELKTERHDFETFKQIAESYDGMSYFDFRLELINGNGELLKYNLNSAGEYEQRIKYISFHMEKDLYLVQGNDTIYPGLYHFERAYEVVPFLTVMLAFDNKKFDREKEFTFVYNDKLFEKGLVKFNYRHKQLVDVPQVVQL
jgi:hypothetical protein